ncbi:MAG: helix-turn-helix domain-containing protein, partial [Sulfuricella sp.]
AGVSGPAWKVADTADALGISSRTIEHIKKQFVEEGLEAALNPPLTCRHHITQFSIGI